MRFVIIDDSPADRELAIRKLSQLYSDAEFVGVGDRAAFEAVLNAPFDIAITDYQLQWSDGLQVLDAIAERWPETPVVMLTDSGSEEIAVEGIKRGLSDYVLKRHLDRLSLSVEESLQRAQDKVRLRKLREALDESEGRYRAISELTSDYAFAFRLEPDGASHLEWISDSYFRDTGYKPADILSNGGWRAVVVPADLPIVEAHRVRVHRGEKSSVECRIRTRDGEIRWLRITSRPVWDAAENRPIRTYSAAQDVTEQKLAEAALRQSETRFRAIFNNAAIGVAIAGGDGTIIAANPAFARMLGYHPTELIGVRVEAITYPEDMHAESKLYAELAADLRTSYQLEKRFVRRDGQLLWTRLTVSRAMDSAKDIELVIGVVEDITKERTAQQTLIQAEKLNLTSTLVANLAHEINNPIQAILGCLGLAEESLGHDDRDTREALRYIHVAADETRRTARIVGALRDLNRRARPEERVRTDVCQLLQRAVDLAADQLNESGVQVFWERTEQPPSVLLVPDRVFQVFLNLILNARDAMPDGGELHLAVERTTAPSGVTITIADTGSGISQELVPNLFEPFHTTKDGGIGLGLFVTRNIIEDHGGTVQVSSEPEHGTTVRIWFPESLTSPT